MATATPAIAWRTIRDLLDHLGGIDPSRVRLDPLLGTATEADLIAANERKESICELVDGVLVEKGMGYTESVLAAILIYHLNAFALPRNLGIVSGADGIMRLVPGLVRGPDVAFTSWGRIPGGRLPPEPIAGFAPDLVVEILSPSITAAEMAWKCREYFGAGVRLVWEVDPRARSVAVYDAPEHPNVLDQAQALDGGPVLPGFALPLADLFGDLDRHGS